MYEKVFVNSQNIATFVCPECKKVKTADVAKYKEIQKAIRIKCKCSCGHSYVALLERRKSYRKEINLPGEYIQLVSGREVDKGIMSVKDISRSGIKLMIGSDAKRPFKIGDRLIVHFNLDDRQRSVIRKEVVIRKISGQFIGAEFCSVDPYDKTLGFYLAS